MDDLKQLKNEVNDLSELVSGLISRQSEIAEKLVRLQSIIIFLLESTEDVPEEFIDEKKEYEH